MQINQINGYQNNNTAFGARLEIYRYLSPVTEKFPGLVKQAEKIGLDSDIIKINLEGNWNTKGQNMYNNGYMKDWCTEFKHDIDAKFIRGEEVLENKFWQPISKSFEDIYTIQRAKIKNFLNMLSEKYPKN